MICKHRILTILLMFLLAILIIGCASTPTPDTSIVWSDDFEDGDMEGWEDFSNMSAPSDFYTVDGGNLTFLNGNGGFAIMYPSTLTIGTWSADILIPDKNGRANEIFFITSQLDSTWNEWLTLKVTIENNPHTVIALYLQDEAQSSRLGRAMIKKNERLTGWHHIDITRDENDNTKIFLDDEMFIESNVDYPHESDYFFLSVIKDSAIDNIVVRDQVVDIQPSEKE